MKTTDPRDMTWDELKDELSGLRSRIWEWLLGHGPATTTQVATGMQIHLLTVRPRVCELVALGFAECIGREGREGIYEAVSMDARAARFAENFREAQLPLKLS